MQNADNRAQTEDRLEQNRLDNDLANAFLDDAPIWFALPARDMPNDTHHAAVREIQRDKHSECKEDFLYESEHSSSENQYVIARSIFRDAAIFD